MYVYALINSIPSILSKPVQSQDFQAHQGVLLCSSSINVDSCMLVATPLAGKCSIVKVLCLGQAQLSLIGCNFGV